MNLEVDRDTAQRIAQRADLIDWIVKVKAHEARLMEEKAALEELVRELVKFTDHDGACAEKKEWNCQSSDPPPQCTCGIRRLYEKIDELVPD